MAPISFRHDASRTAEDVGKAMLPDDRLPHGARIAPTSPTQPVMAYLARFLDAVGAEATRPTHLRLDFVQLEAAIPLRIEGRCADFGMSWFKADPDTLYAWDNATGPASRVYVTPFKPGDDLHVDIFTPCRDCRSARRRR